MSHLTFSAYPGAGEWMRDNLGFSQAVRVGDRIECSGQGKSFPRHFQSWPKASSNPLELC